MIRYKISKLKDKPLLIKYKLLTIIPYIEDSTLKLKAIAYTNNYISNNYNNFYKIYYYFKLIGIYHIKDKQLDTLYIVDKYQNKGFGTKILNNLKDNINTIKVKKANKKAINFYQKNGFSKVKIDNDIIILRKE